jgi:membrane-associated phospholipid phosphatase
LVLLNRRHRIAFAALLLIAFLGLYAFSNLTVLGQSLENSWARSYQPEQTIGLRLDDAHVPPFGFDKATIVLGLLLAIVIAAVRKQWRTLITIAIAGPAAIASSEIFKHFAGRPRLVQTLDYDVSYPSGHAGIALTITAALLVALPEGRRKWIAPPLLLWCIVVSAGLQAEGQHRASEVIGSGLLVAAVFLAVSAATAQHTWSPRVISIWSVRTRIGLGVLAVLAAAIGAWNPVPWMDAVYAGTALLAAGLVGAAALATAAPADRSLRRSNPEVGLDVVAPARNTPPRERSDEAATGSAAPSRARGI